jgi:hypothetical protein
VNRVRFNFSDFGNPTVNALVQRLRAGLLRRREVDGVAQSVGRGQRCDAEGRREFGNRPEERDPCARLVGDVPAVVARNGSDDLHCTVHEFFHFLYSDDCNDRVLGLSLHVFQLLRKVRSVFFLACDIFGLWVLDHFCGEFVVGLYDTLGICRVLLDVL